MVSPYLTAFDDIEDDDDGYLTGQLIVAMPGMGDPRFDKSVIYLCAHSEEGAMGLVINREIEELTFPDLLEQLDIEPAPGATPWNQAGALCCIHPITFKTAHWWLMTVWR